MRAFLGELVFRPSPKKACVGGYIGARARLM